MENILWEFQKRQPFFVCRTLLQHRLVRDELSQNSLQIIREAILANIKRMVEPYHRLQKVRDQFEPVFQKLRISQVS